MTTAPLNDSLIGRLRVGAIANAITGVQGFLTQQIQGLFLAAPKASSATFYVQAATASGNLLPVNKNPDFARNVEISASGASTAKVTINGADTLGYPITETLTLNGASVVAGSKAYSRIISVQLPTAAVTINVGIGVKFGLSPRTLYNTILLALIGGVADTNTGTFVAGSVAAGADYYGTWSPATAPNAANNYQMYWIPTDLANYGVNN